MQNKPNNNAAYTISVILITLFFGCTVEQSHKTLTFFFDGVDKVIFYNDYLSHDSLGQIAAAKREALLKKNRPDLCVHKRLLMPMPGLCFKCHTNFNETYKVVHGPVASGSCLNCHNQHSSRYPKLLTRQGQQICLYCHNSTLVFAAKVHRDIEDAECTMCHNPHGGKTRFMIKENISKDANRIALMDELTYRHLFGQVFCKVPGDINHITEIYILDSRGATVATVHPDDNGKFQVANMHPDQNYTFRFKKDFPDCKINILDRNGKLLYVIEKNKKELYLFDKAAYENVHTLINDAHFLGDSVRSDVVITKQGVNTENNLLLDTAAPIRGAGLTAVGDTLIHTVSALVNVETEHTEKKSKIVVTELPAGGNPKELNEGNNGGQAEKNAPPLTNAVIDTANYKGKIVVKELPQNVPLNDLVDANKVKNTIAVNNTDTNSVQDTGHYKGKIVVRELPSDVNLKQLTDENKAKYPDTAITETPQEMATTTGNKSKIKVMTIPDTANVPVMQRFRTMAGAEEVVTKLAAGGLKLTDLSLQVSGFIDGNVVCVLNSSGDLLDVAPVNKKGEFYLYDFLYFRISLPSGRTGILGQTIYLNEKMEVIETINKHLLNGRYIYIPNSKEPAATREQVRIYSNKENAVLFSSVYFTEGKASLTADGINELKKVIDYLNDHPQAIVYLMAHARSGGTSGYNRQLAEQRAAAATQYLNTNGINPGRIKVKGNRKNKAVKAIEITPGSTEENQRNRRVDVYIKI